MAINVDVAYNGNTIATLENVASAPITYGGNTIATLSDAGTKTLTCAGKMMSTDVVIGSKTLNCAGKVMSSNVIITAESAFKELNILSGVTEVNGSPWIMRTMRYNTSSTQYSLTIDTSGTYLVVTNPSNTSNNQKSGAYCSANDNKINLTEYNNLVLEYDFEVKGTAPSSSVTRYGWITLFASPNNMFASNTYQATGGMAYHIDSNNVNSSVNGTKVTNQRLVLGIVTGGSLVVAFGVNTKGNGVNGILTVKRLYATTATGNDV